MYKRKIKFTKKLEWRDYHYGVAFYECRGRNGLISYNENGRAFYFITPHSPERGPSIKEGIVNSEGKTTQLTTTEYGRTHTFKYNRV